MATETLEDRVTAVEHELAQIKQQLGGEPPIVAGWEKIYGSFADSEGFDEAVRIGRDYREALRPKDDDEAA